MEELNKIVLAEIVSNNGGSIAKATLINKLIERGHSEQDATDAVNDFVNGRLVTFDGKMISI